LTVLAVLFFVFIKNPWINPQILYPYPLRTRIRIQPKVSADYPCICLHMAGPKTKKVTLTIKNPPRAPAKCQKGRNDATSNSPTANHKMDPGPDDIEDEASAGGIDSRRQYSSSGPNLRLPGVNCEVDNTTVDGVLTVQNLQREFNLVKGQLWTTC
jgi:hypothetical protein